MAARHPFTETHSGGKRVRRFSRDVDEEEMVWHRDAEDRVVTVIECVGWFFQRDGELPTEMRPGDVLFIPRRSWHRIARKGSGDLVVEIEGTSPSDT